MYFAPALRSRALDRGFERFLNEAFQTPARKNLAVAQDEKAWTLSLDMPGVAREDLEIDIEGAVVRIATRAEAKRPYQAAYELPEEIDAPASSAKLENGVLTLVLGKKQPVSTARRIEVS